MEKKKALKTQVETGQIQLEAEEIRMKTVEEDVAWFLQKGDVRVVDKVVESDKFSLGVRRMKAACMVAGVEGGKQVIKERIAIEKFIPCESSALLEHTQEMHAEVKYFMETDFSSYLRLGKLNMEGLLYLSSNPDAEGKHPESNTFGTRSSSIPPGM